MRLYLVQHAESKPESEDPARGLTDKGQADVKKVVAFLKPLGLTVSAIWHSGKTRAVQTAEILAQAITASQGVTKHDGLAPLDPVQPIQDQVSRSPDDLMLVGHLPFMGKLASALAAGSDSADAVAFQQGGIVCLERDEHGTWRIRWAVTPEVVG
jgi:phosphohistidine phosphatase